MKFAIPEISWHNKDPVLSVDFQPKGAGEPLRLATGGTDSHVLIWYISVSEKGSVNLEVAADLTRHQKAVNVVRWSPSGVYLASGDDESIIFIWHQKTDKDSSTSNATVINLDQNEEQYKETWVIYKTLRGHMEDVLDISWSPNSQFLASGSVDNKLLLWDITRGKNTVLTDHKGFVQGVSWDPRGQFLATTSSDRVFRTFDVTTKKVTSRSSKAVLPFPPEHALNGVKVRLYHDDTLQTFYRRLHFSPDGLLIAVPAGRIEPEQSKLDVKPINAVYIYTRYCLKVPACVLPCGEPALAVRWAPRKYEPRPTGPPSALPTVRMLLAVAIRRAVLLYDTQQKAPLAIISNIHYTRLTDLTWSPDGQTLVASSTDGFCSVVTFSQGELGEFLPETATQDGSEPMDVQTEEAKFDKTKENLEKTSEEVKTKVNPLIKFKKPTEKQNNVKPPIKLDLLVETAMPSWSDNSSNEIINPKEKPEIMEIEDSEDVRLVYEETVDESMDKRKSVTLEEVNETQKDNKETKDDLTIAGSPESKEAGGNPSNTDFLKQAKVTDIKEAVAVKSVASPKAPRRVSFVTLSSPKNSKKKC